MCAMLHVPSHIYCIRTLSRMVAMTVTSPYYISRVLHTKAKSAKGTHNVWNEEFVHYMPIVLTIVATTAY